MDATLLDRDAVIVPRAGKINPIVQLREGEEFPLGCSLQYENLKGNIMFWELLPSLTIGFIFFAIIGIAYAVTAKIYGHKLAIKAIAQFLAVAGILAAIFYLVSLWLSPAQKEIIWTAIYICFSLLFIILFIAHVKGKNQIPTEKVILEIGLGDSGFWLIIGGVIFLASSYTSISEFANRQYIPDKKKFWSTDK